MVEDFPVNLDRGNVLAWLNSTPPHSRQRPALEKIARVLTTEQLREEIRVEDACVKAVALDLEGF